MIKKFENFSDVSSKSRNNLVLLFYSFDFDDNILFMPTKIHMEKLVDGEWKHIAVSTSKFAEVRNDIENWRILNNDPNEAFAEFRDFGPRGENAFLEDVISAIDTERLGPSWDDFKECLINGSLFSIITARGHESFPMRMGVEYIIDNCLSEDDKYRMHNNLLKFIHLFGSSRNIERIPRGEFSKTKVVSDYLDNCDFIGVSSPSRGGTPSSPEKAKEEALLLFKEKIDKFATANNIKAKIGFSDDDVRNVKHIEDLVEEIHNERFPSIISFTIKNTKEPDNIKKNIWSKKMESNSPYMDGTQTSVLPFTKWNNMTERLYPKDSNKRDYDNQLRTMIGQLNDYRPKFKKIKNKRNKKAEKR